MKKILAVLFSLFLITPASADVLLNLSGDKWGPSITSHFSGDNAVNAAAKVRDLLQASPAGISAKDVWDICVAGGLNIAEGSGKNQCLSFLQSLLVFGDSNYIRVCVPGELSKIKDENIRTISKCEKDFFNYTNVQMIQAVELAKLYAKKKWGDDGVVCSNTYNKAENDYWLSCKSTKTGAFYEFKFDDVKESVDTDIQYGVKESICRMHGGTEPRGSACKSVTEEVCGKINEDVKVFGGTAQWGQNGCTITFDVVTDFNKLNKGCGINPLAFCRKRDLQIQSNLGIYDLLRQHVADECNVQISEVRCDPSFKTFRGTSGGCNLGY